MWCLSMRQVWSDDHASLSGCITLAVWHVTGRLTCLADSVTQCHSTADNTSLLNQAHPQYQSGTGGSTVEKPARHWDLHKLASHLAKEPNSRSWGHESESPMQQELGAVHWQKVERPLGSGLSTSVSDPYSFFTDPDPEVEAGGQYGSGSGSNPDPGL